MRLKKFAIFFIAIIVFGHYSNAQDCKAEQIFNTLKVECLPTGSHLYCVSLEVSDKTDANGNALRHVWFLGDGNMKPGPKIEHCYSEYGEYDVILVSSRTVGDITFKDTTHYPLNVGEIALIQEIKEDRFQYFFDGSSAFINKDYEIINYYWDFGDGHYGCEMLVSNRYTQAGEYEVRLMVEGRSRSGQKRFICGSKKIQIR